MWKFKTPFLSMLPFGSTFWGGNGRFEEQIPELSATHKDRADIEHVCHVLIPNLLELLPSDSGYKHFFDREGELWRYDFACHFAGGHFTASAQGKTPIEAFAIARNKIEAQVREWHITRFNDELLPLLPEGNRTVIPKIKRVLIVDDDVDMAEATQIALRQLGFETEIATRHEGLHRKIISTDVDLILLDWKLNDEVTADFVVEKASRLIGAFSDLRRKYQEKRPQVVTYSALKPQQIHFPHIGTQYFDHLDHWQKPMPFPEMVKRASEFLHV